MAHGVPQLVDDLLGRAPAALVHPDAARQRHAGGVEGDLVVGARQVAQGGELAGDEHEVDGAPHRRTDAHVGVVAGAPHDVDGAADEVGLVEAGRLHGVLFDDGESRRPPTGSPWRPGRRGRRPRPRCGPCRPRRRGSSPRPGGTPGAATMRPRRGTVQLALGHHGDEQVERLLGDAVDLLDVEQRRPRAGRATRGPSTKTSSA